MKNRVVALLVVVAIAAIGWAAYVHSQPSVLVLTGIVTTNDVIVSPQIVGQIAELNVKEGDPVHKDQPLAVIRPDELRADTTYYSSTAAGLASQVRESEAALRYQERQTTDQIRQAEAALRSFEAQVKAAEAAVEAVRLTFTRTQDLAEKDRLDAGTRSGADGVCCGAGTGRFAESPGRRTACS